MTRAYFELILGNRVLIGTLADVKFTLQPIPTQNQNRLDWSYNQNGLGKRRIQMYKRRSGASTCSRTLGSRRC